MRVRTADEKEDGTMADTMTSEAQVRRAFWEGFPAGHPWRKKRNGDYCTDCRVEFVDFVDMLARDGIITEALAQRVTL